MNLAAHSLATIVPPPPISLSSNSHASSCLSDQTPTGPHFHRKHSPFIPAHSSCGHHITFVDDLKICWIGTGIYLPYRVNRMMHSLISSPQYQLRSNVRGRRKVLGGSFVALAQTSCVFCQEHALHLWCTRTWHGY